MPGGFSFRKFFRERVFKAKPVSKPASKLISKPPSKPISGPDSVHNPYRIETIWESKTRCYTIKKSTRFDSFKLRNDKIESTLDDVASDLLKENGNIKWMCDVDGLMYFKIYVRKNFYEMLKESISNNYKLTSKELLDQYMLEQIYFCEHRINFFSRGLKKVKGVPIGSNDKPSIKSVEFKNMKNDEISLELSRRFIERYKQGRWYYQHKKREYICPMFETPGWVEVKAKVIQLVKDKEELWSDIISQSPLFKYTEEGLGNKNKAILILKNQTKIDKFSKGVIKFLSKDNNDKLKHSKDFFFFKEGTESIDKQKAGGTCTLHVINEINLDVSHGLCFYVTAYRYELLYQAIFANAICDEINASQFNVKLQLQEYIFHEVKCRLTPDMVESITKNGNIFSYKKSSISDNNITGENKVFILSELTDDMVGLTCDEVVFEKKDADYVTIGVWDVDNKNIGHALLAKKKDNCIYIYDSNFGAIEKLDSLDCLVPGVGDGIFFEEPVLAIPEEQLYHQEKLPMYYYHNKITHFDPQEYENLAFEYFIRLTK